MFQNITYKPIKKSSNINMSAQHFIDCILWPLFSIYLLNLCRYLDSLTIWQFGNVSLCYEFFNVIDLKHDDHGGNNQIRIEIDFININLHEHPIFKQRYKSIYLNIKPCVVYLNLESIFLCGIMNCFLESKM